MKLYLIHCGFYDDGVCEGLYESHANFFVVAESFDHARLKAKQLPEFKNKRMHVDGLQEIEAVEGYTINLEADTALAGCNLIHNFKHRDLATKPQPVPNL